MQTFQKQFSAIKVKFYIFENFWGNLLKTSVKKHITTYICLDVPRSNCGVIETVRIIHGKKSSFSRKISWKWEIFIGGIQKGRPYFFRDFDPPPRVDQMSLEVLFSDKNSNFFLSSVGWLSVIFQITFTTSSNSCNIFRSFQLIFATSALSE